MKDTTQEWIGLLCTSTGKAHEGGCGREMETRGVVTGSTPAGNGPARALCFVEFRWASLEAGIQLFFVDTSSSAEL